MTDLLQTVDLADAAESKPRWVLTDTLPVGLTILGGPPKSVKKSTLTYAWAVAASGIDASGMAPGWMVTPAREPGPVLMFSAEAEPGDIKYSLRIGAGIMPPAGHIHVVRDQFVRLDAEAGRASVMATLENLGPVLTILDPLRDFHSLDEKDSGEMISVVGPLRRWAIDHDSAIVLVHHTTKPTEGRGALDPNSLRGSSALFGKADGLIMAAQSDKPGAGWIDYSGIYKRGGSWQATVRLGVWENMHHAEEWFSPKVIGFMKVMAAGSDLRSARAQCQLVPNDQWEPVRAQLVRAGLLIEKNKVLMCSKLGQSWVEERSVHGA